MPVFYLPVSFLFPVRVRFLGCQGNGRGGGVGDATAEDEIAELFVCLYEELERRKGLSCERFEVVFGPAHVHIGFELFQIIVSVDGLGIGMAGDEAAQTVFFHADIGGKAVNLVILRLFHVFCQIPAEALHGLGKH